MLNTVYDCLSDARKKHAYDTNLKQEAESHQSCAHHGRRFAKCDSDTRSQKVPASAKEEDFLHTLFREFNWQQANTFGGRGEHPEAQDYRTRYESGLAQKNRSWCAQIFQPGAVCFLFLFISAIALGKFMKNSKQYSLEQRGDYRFEIMTSTIRKEIPYFVTRDFRDKYHISVDGYSGLREIEKSVECETII